ncbi:MAG: hypothetical protein AAFQ64_03340 [Pseudomonadota bacterium]
MRVAVFCIACVASVPVAAQAACPTADNLRKGAIVFTVDGEAEVHTRAPNGVVTVLSEPDAEGVAVRSILAHGVHVLQLADLIDGVVDHQTVWRFAFTLPQDQLPTPTPNATWQVGSTAYIDGTAEDEKIQHTWGPLGQYTIGACTYAAIPVRADYDGEEYDHVEEMIYFSDLGTAILTSYSDVEGRESYTYTDIRAR